MRIRIRDQILANLAIDVVLVCQGVDGVLADRDPVDQFIGVVGMHQHAHRGRKVVDTMEVPLDESTEIPQAGVHLLE